MHSWPTGQVLAPRQASTASDSQRAASAGEYLAKRELAMWPGTPLEALNQSSVHHRNRLVLLTPRRTPP
jgi:hypothetical protein